LSSTFPANECTLTRPRVRTYQEARLSLRRLVFLPSQIALQCTSYIHLSAFHSPISRSTLTVPWRTSREYNIHALFRHPIPTSPLWSLRADLRIYYERYLRYPTDVLHAFQGVVNSYRHHPHLSGTLAHFWGLHVFASDCLDAKSAFIAELTWFVVSRPGCANRAAKQPAYVPAATHAQQDTNTGEAAPRFPSWSWAAKMAADMSSRNTALDYKEFNGRDPFDGSATLIHADDIAITFTRLSACSNDGEVGGSAAMRRSAWRSILAIPAATYPCTPASR
jgi:hypothetical protein